MSIKEIKSGTLYKEYELKIPYEEINQIIDCLLYTSDAADE